MHKRCMTNGFRLGLLAAFLGVMASSFGEADLMHHDIPRLPSLLWHSKGSSVGFIHIVVGFQNPEAGHGGKGNTKNSDKASVRCIGPN
jgi:hypothetical protein